MAHKCSYFASALIVYRIFFVRMGRIPTGLHERSRLATIFGTTRRNVYLSKRIAFMIRNAPIVHLMSPVRVWVLHNLRHERTRGPKPGQTASLVLTYFRSMPFNVAGLDEVLRDRAYSILLRERER